MGAWEGEIPSRCARKAHGVGVGLTVAVVVCASCAYKELRNAIALLVFQANAFETQLPFTPDQKQQIKSLEDQITVARYLETIFPE